MNNHKFFDMDAILTIALFMAPYFVIGCYVFGSIILGLLGF